MANNQLEFTEAGLAQLRRKNRWQLAGVSVALVVMGAVLGKIWSTEEAVATSPEQLSIQTVANNVDGQLTEEQANQLDVQQAVVLEPMPGEENAVLQQELANPLNMGQAAASMAEPVTGNVPTAAMVAVGAATATAVVANKKDNAVYELKEGQETVTEAAADGSLRTVIQKAEPNQNYDRAPVPAITFSSVKADKDKEAVAGIVAKPVVPRVAEKTAAEKAAEAKQQRLAEEKKAAAEKAKQQAALKEKQAAEAKQQRLAEEKKAAAEKAKQQAALKEKQAAEAKQQRLAEEKKAAAEKAKQQAALKEKQAVEAKQQRLADEKKAAAEKAKQQAALKEKQAAEAKQQRLAEEKKAAAEKAKQQAALKEKQAAEAKQQRLAEEKKAAAEKAKQQAALKEKQAAEAKQKRLAEEKKAAAEKAKQQAALKEKQAAEAKQQRLAEEKKAAAEKAKQQAALKEKQAAEAKAKAALNNQAASKVANPKAILDGQNSGKAFVQAGAYANENQAKQIQQRLAKAGVQTHIQEINTSKGKMYRVRTSTYPNRNVANQTLGRIRMQGVEGKIIGQQ